ncbi:MAG: TonB-dependent receptor [Pedobacter sp.]|nr:MAG: TonB-dependent receptor [Pedobacter sp.]
MKKYYSFFLLFVFSLCASNLFAQSNKRISGVVVDTGKVAIRDANVMLVAGKDTLRTTTSNEGFFSFTKIKSEDFHLKISITGYQEFTKSYAFGKEKELNLKELELKLAGNMLKEVVIKSKPNPIRIMQDTVEYNAAAYQVLEGDNVADLMKQFPGVEIDDEYNVKTMGKEMVKLRIDGKDFFTNNVKDFISKLPAAIVSKIQVIDDFGDEANFTGIKTGEPTKMLNIVTKPGMNKGKFGNLSVNGGTNDLIGSNANINLWSDTKQSSGGLSYGTSNNGAGKSNNAGIMASYADRIGKNMGYGFNYNGGLNDAAYNNEQAVETLNPLGTFYNKTLSNGDNRNNAHNFNSTFNLNNKKIYFNGSIGASYNEGKNSSSSFNNQSGVIRQDLNNINQSSNKSPRINGNFNFSKILKNKRNSLSANFGFFSSSTNSDQNINTNTLYYDKVTQVLEKDSLLNRNLVSNNNNNNMSLGFNYSLGLKSKKDTLARKSINFNYSLSVGKSNRSVYTIVFDNISNVPNYVDSLSTDYSTLSINQTLGLNYNYSNKKMRYNLGINAKPTLLTSHYINLNQKIRNNNFNYAPNLNLSRTITKGKTISVNYSGINNSPSLYQLQPVRNTQNLQNIVIGNPNLKPSFSHNISSNYNYVNAKTGISAQTGLSFNATQNEIVNNVVLIPDTLNSLKQETRFENTNGNYNVRSNYVLSIPIKKNKYSISYGGNFSLSNRALFINNEKSFNKGFNLSQQITANLTSKKVSIGANAGYNFSSNNNSSNPYSQADIALINLGQISGATFYRTHNYTADVNGSLRLAKFTLNTSINYNLTNNEGEINSSSFKNVQSLSLSLSARTTIKKTYRIGIYTSKRYNDGYALANTNPLIINANLSKSFFKNQALSLNVNANDLLNEGNNLARTISGNSIIDSRTNQITRVFTFGLSYNLSKFGGRNFRVDAD